MTGEALLAKRREIWVDVQRNMGSGVQTAAGEHVEARNVTAEHVPDKAAVVKDLKKFATVVKKEMANKKVYFKTPYVDHSRVKDSLKGKGFGAALYVYGAKKLGEQGKVLRSSGIQSDDAQALWGRFAKKFPKNHASIMLNYMGEKSKAFVLDFRA